MKKKTVFKVLKISGTSIFYLFIVIVLLFSIANLQQKDKSTYPNLFGYGFLSVQTNSMNGTHKDSFKAGDMITVKKASDKAISKLEVGDIITFYDQNLSTSANASNLSTYLNTHRIVYITENGYFITQGDYVVDQLSIHFDTENLENNNASTNPNVSITEVDSATGSAYSFYETVAPDSVVGIYQGQIGGMGTFMASLTKPQSPLFLCLIVLPILIFFLIEVFMVIKNILKVNTEKQKKTIESSKETMLKELEAQKEAMRLEILAQLQKEQAASAAPQNTEVKEETKAEPEEDKAKDAE